MSKVRGRGRSEREGEEETNRRSNLELRCHGLTSNSAPRYPPLTPDFNQEKQPEQGPASVLDGRRVALESKGREHGKAFG
jgi:hypothetical protein